MSSMLEMPSATVSRKFKNIWTFVAQVLCKWSSGWLLTANSSYHCKVHCTVRPFYFFCWSLLTTISILSILSEHFTHYLNLLFHVIEYWPIVTVTSYSLSHPPNDTCDIYLCPSATRDNLKFPLPRHWFFLIRTINTTMIFDPSTPAIYYNPTFYYQGRNITSLSVEAFVMLFCHFLELFEKLKIQQWQTGFVLHVTATPSVLRLAAPPPARPELLVQPRRPPLCGQLQAPRPRLLRGIEVWLIVRLGCRGEFEILTKYSPGQC